MIIVRPNPTYKESFKRKVLTEIERGEISIEGARRKYGIGESMTISNWRKKIVNFPLIETENWEMVDETKFRELEAQNEALKKQLMQQEMELVIYKTMIEISDNLKDPAVKKKIETELSKRLNEMKEKRTEEGTQSENCAGSTE